MGPRATIQPKWKAKKAWLYFTVKFRTKTGTGLVLSKVQFQSGSINYGTGTVRVTLFAPIDYSLHIIFGNIRPYRSIVLRHFVHCRLLWNNLTSVEATGIQLATLLDGFMVDVTKDSEFI